MLYAERHRPRGVGLAGAVHRTWAVAEKNDWQFSNPRIDTGIGTYLHGYLLLPPGLIPIMFPYEDNLCKYYIVSP